MPKRLPIRIARSIAQNHSCQQVIIVAWDGMLTHVVTYGTTIEASAQAAEGGNFVKRALGWPENLCQSEPSRVRKLQARIQELEQALAELKQSAEK